MQNTIETITTEQADTMLDLMLGQSNSPSKRMRGVRNRCMMLLMLDAGLRVGELVQVLQSDLCIASEPVSTLRVRKEIAKGKHERLVPISEKLKIAIGEMQHHIWSKLQPEHPGFAFVKDYLGDPISTRRVEQIIAQYGFAATGQLLHPHVLRHTFATRLMACTSMRNVQVLLGHKNIQTTQIYTHPNNQDLKKAINTMSET